jgi:hypothetical protein
MGAQFWLWSNGFGNNRDYPMAAMVQELLPALGQIGIALYLVWRLNDNLKRRKFALEGRTL